MEFCFKTSDMELDFISKITKKQNINYISENDLQNSRLVKKIFESLSSVSKNLTDKNIYNFQLNKSLLLLYLVKNYTNKTIKQCEYGQFLTKKNVLLTLLSLMMDRLIIHSYFFKNLNKNIKKKLK